MKIITDNKAYVQLNDLAYLMKASVGKSIPETILNKVFGEMFICTDSNRYDFMEFNLPEEIKFFKNLSYSVDYMEYKDLSDKEIIEAGQKIAEEMNAIATKFNELNEHEKGDHLDLVDEHDLLEFKMYSLRDIIWFRQGKLKMKLPKIESKDTSQKQESGLKKLINKFKRR